MKPWYLPKIRVKDYDCAFDTESPCIFQHGIEEFSASINSFISDNIDPTAYFMMTIADKKRYDVVADRYVYKARIIFNHVEDADLYLMLISN